MTDNKRSLQDQKQQSPSRSGDAKQEYNPAKNNPKMEQSVSKSDQQSKTSR